MKAPVLVANRKTQELQPTQWTDKIFTGDNPSSTAKLTHEARIRDAQKNVDFKKQRADAAKAQDEE